MPTRCKQGSRIPPAQGATKQVIPVCDVSAAVESASLWLSAAAGAPPGTKKACFLAGEALGMLSGVALPDAGACRLAFAAQQHSA